MLSKHRCTNEKQTLYLQRVSNRNVQLSHQNECYDTWRKVVCAIITEPFHSRYLQQVTTSSWQRTCARYSTVEASGRAGYGQGWNVDRIKAVYSDAMWTRGRVAHCALQQLEVRSGELHTSSTQGKLNDMFQYHCAQPRQLQSDR